MQPSQHEATTETAEARPDTVSALERGISVLRCFSQERPVLGHAEIAKMTGIPRPTVNRLVATLVANGMLKPALATDRFTLGPGVVALARVFLVSLDVRAGAEVQARLLAAREAGAAVLLISEDLDEVLALADRIGVMSAGRLVAEFQRPADRQAIGHAMVNHA